MKRLKKILKRVFIFLVVLAVLAGVGGFLVVHFYEDEVKAFALEKINESLKTQADVEEVDLTVFRQFPNASLAFSNVLIRETFPEADTLMHAEKVYLEFSLWDLIRKNYVVKEVDINQAVLRLKRNKAGEDNYHFWKPSEGDGGNFAFELRKVGLKNTNVFYGDQSADFTLDIDANKLALSGNFEQKIFDLSGDANLFATQLQVGTTNYLSEKNVDGDFELSIDTEKNAYLIKSAALEVEGVPFTASGGFEQKANLVYCDLSIDAPSVNLPTLISALPKSYHEALTDYEVDGYADIKGKIFGMAGSGAEPQIKADFTVRNGDFHQLSTGIAISDINGSGSFQKDPGEPEVLRVNEGSANFEGGEFTFSGAMEDLDQPWMNVQVAGEFDLDNLRQFAKIESLEVLSGDCEVNASFKGKIHDWKNITKADLNTAETSGKITVADGELQWRGSPHLAENINGTILLDDNDAAIRSFEAYIGESDLKLEGFFRNFMPFLLVEGEAITIEANLLSENLNWDELLANTNANEPSDDPYKLSFPKTLNFNIDFNVSHLQFRKFEASEIYGDARLKNQVLTIDPIHLKTSEGSFDATLTANGKTNNLFVVNCSAHLERMDVKKLFYSFENFGQDFIRDDHLKGTATADVTFRSQLNSALQFDDDKIYSLIDIKLENGELVNLRSMENISDYLRHKRLLASFIDVDKLDNNLRHIRFSTLENQIEIKNQKIFIPAMDIESSAMDLSVNGTHSFQNAIDYSLKFNLRQVLAKSNRESEFGPVADDGLGTNFFLSMTGTTENPEFGYDQVAARENRREQFQQEKENFKNMLKEEFGRNKNTGDEEVGNPNSTSEDPGVSVNVEWGGETKADETKKDDSEPKTEEEKKKQSWRDKFKLNDKKEEKKDDKPKPPPKEEDDDF
ncbi:hypothetical protein [Halocola ammonii]